MRPPIKRAAHIPDYVILSGVVGARSEPAAESKSLPRAKPKGYLVRRQ